jgi:hypothetical protein
MEIVREWIQCDNCSAYVILDDIYEELYSSTVCNECLAFDDLLPPDADIDWEFHGDSDTYFGVEIEFPGDKKISYNKTYNKYLEFKLEESLLQGFEVVTHPSSYDIHKRKISKMFKHNIFRCDNLHNSAFHMHINKTSPLFKNDVLGVMSKVMYFIYKNADTIKKVGGRTDAEYERFCSTKPATVKDENMTVDYIRKEIDDINIENQKTYCCMIHEHTIEFRFFNATNNKRKYMHNIDFVIALIYICANEDNPTSLSLAKALENIEKIKEEMRIV